ncbi:MAG: hypothetical protein H7Y38_00870 [Armatimonadetes bacterium]|nr:hypothetical protein [Armatimonadota bacterium]
MTRSASADSLGDRMKHDYENRTRFFLPRRTYTLLRVDGKSFHTYTKHCARPFDTDLMSDMDTAAIALCENIAGARLAFVQSDEISVLLTDFGQIAGGDSPGDTHSEAWFDGNLQKIASVSASIATVHFNAARARRGDSANTPAYFDSRVWTIPSRLEVFHYFLWRQNDATRNSISMTAQAHFLHSDLQNKNSNALQEMLWQERGINWNDISVGFKRGRIIERVGTVGTAEYTDKRTGEARQVENVTRHSWQVTEPPVFAQERDYLLARIPAMDGA